MKEFILLKQTFEIEISNEQEMAELAILTGQIIKSNDILLLKGEIGAGKSYFSRLLGYPRFDADHEVKKIYKNNRKVYLKIKKEFPKKISSFPLNKLELSKIILENKNNIKKINKIVHKEVRKKLVNFFLTSL